MRCLLVVGTLFCLLFSLSAVAQDAKPKPKNLLKPTHQTESWRLEEHETAKAVMAPAEETMTFDVKAITGTDWHVQAVQTGLELKDGQEYVLSFEIKANARRIASVSAGIDQEDWHDIGLREELYLRPEFQKQEFTFTATDVAKGNKNRICFQLGTDLGLVTIKNLSLVEKK